MGDGIGGVDGRLLKPPLQTKLDPEAVEAVLVLAFLVALPLLALVLLQLRVFLVPVRLLRVIPLLLLVLQVSSLPLLRESSLLS